MNGLLEIYTNKEWMILPSFVHGILPTVMYNSQNHTMLGIDREKRRPMAMSMAGADIFREYEVTQDGDVLPTYDSWAGIDYLKQLQVPFVNIMPIDGPITRNGGACSYGSKEIRDWMMKAADNKYCRAHIFITNTPGGSAWAKNDFQMGIDYAHARGQRVYDLIDGLCASAGEYKASLCDEVYVVNLMDQLGCVGVMASFFTQKNGEKNQYTGETYREYYDPESVDKNKEMRDIAEDDDATLLIEELKKLGEEFRADMKAAFPNADVDEHLKGKMFNAKDVMGILCDGQMLLGDLVSRAFAVADGVEKPIERTAGRKLGKLPEIDTKKAKVRGVNLAKQNNIISPTNNSIMTENYQIIAQLAGAADGKFEKVDADGVYMNTSLLDTLQTNIEALQKEKADALALVESLTAEKDNLNAQILTIKTENAQAVENLNAEHQKAIDDLNAEHSKAIDDLNAEHSKAIEDLNAKIADQEQDITAKEETIGNLQHDIEGQKAQIEQLQADVNGAKESLTTAENTIAERDQQITDLNAQLTELQNDPGQGAQAGAAPKNNGGGAEAPQVVVNQYVYDPALSYDKNRELEKKWNEEHGK
jgi:protease-4